MNTFFDKFIKRIFPCILIMLVSCCVFTVNAGAETFIQMEEKQLFGSPDVSTASLERSVDLDALKEYLRKEFLKCPDYIDISSFNIPNTNDNYKILTNMIWYECPELFHIVSLGAGVSNGILTTVTAKYEYSQQEYSQMYKECMIQANTILDGIAGNNNLTDVQKALLLHDRLALQCEYDIDNYYNNSIPSESYSMYGALVNGFSVCQGYSEAYLYLLEKAGIENRLCSSKELNHVWNIVTITGKEYHVDVTWDDPIYDQTGKVLHINFLRSSDGIYESEHYATDYDTSPTDTTYDNYFWQGSKTAFQYAGNEIYYIEDQSGSIKKYSNQSTVVEGTDKWPASTSGSYWVGSFSRLSSDGTNLYYNLSKDVYKYTVSTGKTEKIWSPDLSAGELFRIYGFMYKDGYLICDINDTPVFEQGDKQTYQQRYLYHDLASSTLESVSIITVPKKTEYYIGDSLSTEGLLLKLSYSNGLTKFVSEGFAVNDSVLSSGGNKNVTITYDGLSATFTVDVRTPRILLDASSATIELKDYFLLNAITDPANVDVAWTTSDSSVATVYDGEIESVSTGTATITASFIYNGYTYSADCNVIVECKHPLIVSVKGKDSTCTETGLTDGKKCSVCETVTVAQLTIAAKGHTESTREEILIDSSCSNDGSYNLVTYCNVCNEILKTETKVIPATGNHSYVTEIKRENATCNTAGYVVMSCVCGETKTETLDPDADNHENIVILNAVEPTCTEAGLTEGKICTVCGVITLEQQIIEKTGHSEVTVKGENATCTENGLTDGKMCTVCGEITLEQQIIEKTGHSEVTVKGENATCTENGLTDGKMCTVCGEITLEQQIIEKTGHSEIDIEAKAPTCTEKGSEAGKICSVCNEIVVAVKETDMLGHNPGEWETVKEAQIGKDGLIQQKCTRCGDVLEEKIIPALAEKPKNALGDVNNDGKVTAADARLVLRMSAKIDPYSDDQIVYLDLNKDGKITAADARILLRISAKIESIEKYM